MTTYLARRLTTLVATLVAASVAVFCLLAILPGKPAQVILGTQATPQSVAQYQIIFGEGALKYQIVPTFAVDGGVRVGYQDFNNAIRFNTLTQVTGFVGLSYTPVAYRWNP